MRTSVSTKYSEFQGAIIEQNYVSELYPFLPYIFFDSGKAEIAARYRMFADSTERIGFTDSTILGGTIQKYHDILNVVGFRMRNSPDASIRLVGTNSARPEGGKDRRLSKRRAENVRNYLIRIWGIAPERIILSRPRDLPRIPSPPGDPWGAVENRRVEIESDDIRIMRPVLQSDLRCYAQPDSVQFRIDNGIPDEQITHREIEILRGDTLWHVMRDIGTADTLSPGFEWGRWNSTMLDAFPGEESPYHIRLVVWTTDGRTIRSNDLEIPVLIITNEVKRRERMIDSVRTRLLVLRFDFGSARLTPLDKRIVREYILPMIGPRAHIIVTGYADDSERSPDLAERRARALVDALETMGATWTQVTARSAGNARPIYSNDLPEGRFFNRTVEINITSPTP